MSKLPVMVFIAAILVTSFVMMNVQAANALVQRDWSYGFDDNIRVARWGNNLVCGDHMCAPGEWDQLQAKLTASQLGYQGGRNATNPSEVPSTPTTTTTPSTVPSTTTTAPAPQMQNGVTPKLCSAVKDVLSSAGVTDSAINAVMADLGCS